MYLNSALRFQHLLGNIAPRPSRMQNHLPSLQINILLEFQQAFSGIPKSSVLSPKKVPETQGRVILMIAGVERPRRKR